MTHLLWVAIGGAVGASLRFATGQAAKKVFEDADAVSGTVIANAAGSLAAGIIAAAATSLDIQNQSMTLFLSVGLIGSLTTFSTFTLEIYQRISGPWKTLLLYLCNQLILALGLVFAGYYITIWVLNGGGVG